MSDQVDLADKAGEGMRALWPAALLLFCGLPVLAVATVLSDGVEGQYVVVASPFGVPVAEVISIADGAILAVGGFDNVMIAASDRPGFAGDLERAGALLVFRAPSILGCGSPSEAGRKHDG